MLTTSGSKMVQGTTCGQQEGSIDTEPGSDLLVTFRSIHYYNYPGFVLIAICMNTAEQDMPGCLPIQGAESKQNTLSDNYYGDTQVNKIPLQCS